MSNFPNGVPLTVEMNKTVYLRFISGDKTDLNNLFVPPGIQTFHVTAQNGSKQVVSNIVSNEFKAKKKKNLKIELRNQGTVPAGAAAPLTSGAQIFVSLSTPLFNQAFTIVQYHRSIPRRTCEFGGRPAPKLNIPRIEGRAQCKSPLKKCPAASPASRSMAAWISPAPRLST